jgi:HEAT repeat protein
LAAALHSDDTTDCYAAIRAAGATRRTDLSERLAVIAMSEDDWRVRLEAIGSLATLDPDTWTGAVVNAALDAEHPPEVRIEATFVLSELHTSQSVDGLLTVAAPESGSPSEIRAAAAWGLGQGRIAPPRSILPLTIDDDLVVRLHALVALEELPGNVVDVLKTWLSEGRPRTAASAACLLERHRRFGDLLDAYEIGGVASLWAIRSLGNLPEAEVRAAAGNRLTSELKEALLPLWMDSTTG